MAGFKGEATIVLLSYAARWAENSGKPPHTSLYTARFAPTLFLIHRWVLKLDTQQWSPFYETLKRASLDAFRHRHWFLGHASDVGAMMQLWTETASSLQPTDDVSGGALLRMASWDDLLPHIPAPAWEWLKKRPFFRPDCQALKCEVNPNAFDRVQLLGDIEITTSYLFIFWSEWS